MARSYSFSILRLAPTGARGEQLNIGLAVIGQNVFDVRVGKRLDKVKAISAAIDEDDLVQLMDRVAQLEQQLRVEGMGAQERVDQLSGLGPIKFSALGSFVIAEPSEYEDKVLNIMKAMVDPEPAISRIRQKRNKLFSQVRAMLYQNGVLARKGEDLSSHRIVANLEIDQGLIADFALQNGAMHFVETVDASNVDNLKRAIADVAVAGLVFERARMRYGEPETRSRLVYTAANDIEKSIRPSLDAVHNQGAELFNWASADDQNRLVQGFARLASPIEPHKRRRSSKAH
jgi:hypothetical protein